MRSEYLVIRDISKKGWETQPCKITYWMALIYHVHLSSNSKIKIWIKLHEDSFVHPSALCFCHMWTWLFSSPDCLITECGVQGCCLRVTLIIRTEPNIINCWSLISHYGSKLTLRWETRRAPELFLLKAFLCLSHLTEGKGTS